MRSVGEDDSSIGDSGGGTRHALADRSDTTVRLAAALTELGIDCDVEARGTLAVLTPADGSSSATAGTLADAGLRAVVVAAARDLGFTHIALELRGEDG